MKCFIDGVEIGNSNIYLKLPKGKLIGPLCSDCMDRNTDSKKTGTAVLEGIDYQLEYIDACTVTLRRT